MERQDFVIALAPAALATAHTGSDVDRAIAGGPVEFVVQLAAGTATTNATLTLQEADTATPTGTVAAADQSGDTTVVAGAGAAAGIGRLLYLGSKRFVRVLAVGSSATGSISAVAVFQHPRKAP